MINRIVAWIITGFAVALFSQPPAPNDQLFRLPRITEEIHLDGKLDEPVWKRIAPLPLTMNSPTFGGTPTERTEIRIAYDDNYLYASGAFYDSDPSGVRANNLIRDGVNFSDDRFALILDTFNDNENALGFLVNPAGARADFTVYNDGESNRGPPLNFSWNTFWDAAVTRTDEGWFVEVRIPFTSLRFQDHDGRVIMGLIAWRAIARKNEVLTFPAIPTKFRWGTYKPSIAQDVVLEGVYSRKPIYISPYVLGGIEQTPELNANETAYTIQQKLTRNVGLDVKYGLTSNLTMDLTLNTDFAQVEADDERVNLTRFSLFFPEKRPFFQERAAVFDFNTGEQSRVFYSRRIGLGPGGELIPIYGGIRLIGRIGRWDMGFLNMQTAPYDAADLPSENFGVLRFRRQVLNSNSYVGTILTSRISTRGNINLVYGFDGIFKVKGDDYFSINWAQSLDSDSLQALSLPRQNTGRLRIAWDKRTDRGLFYRARLGWSGDEYNPGVGFVRRVNFTRLLGQIGYGWYPGKESLLFKHSLGIQASGFIRNSDQQLETGEVGLEWRAGPKIGGFFRFQTKLNYESILDTFYLSSDAFIPAGTYQFWDNSFFFLSPFGYLVRFRLNGNFGYFYDGTRYSFSISPTWSVSQHLELSSDFQYNAVDLPKRDQQFRATIVRLRVKYNLNTRFFMSTFAQWNSFAERITLNFRLRYNPKDGNDLYLVYNENLEYGNENDMPPPPLSQNRTILIKYTHTFQRAF